MELRVRFAETDQMRIAHHAAYVVWLEAARVEWLRRHGLRYRDLEDQGVSLAVAAVELRYRTAARFDDRLVVEVRLLELRSRRLRFAYRVERLEDDGGRTHLASGVTVHVPTTSAGRAARLPADWLAAIAPLVDAPDAA
jgi:acyl-CoA thioester hydrolase